MFQKAFIFFLIGYICFNSFTVFAANKKTVYYDTGITVQGMEKVAYLAIDGQDVNLKYTIPKIEFEGNIYEAFYLENPIPKQKLPEEMEIPEYLNKDRILGISILYTRLDISDVNRILNLNLTKEEYTAAAQTAISFVVAENSQKYKIKLDSIKNTSVITTAQWLVKTIDEYLKRKPDNLTILEYLYPEVQITVNSDIAKGNVEGYFNYFGPYKIESSIQTNLEVFTETTPTNYAFVHSIGGEVIDSLKVNQEFYVRFDKKLISDIEIVFCVENDIPIIKSYEDIFFIAKEPKKVTAVFTIGNKNSLATIEYTKFDSLTKAPIAGTVIEIKDMKGNLVDTVTTNEKGVAVSTIKVGSYKISEKSSAEGYSLDTSVKEVSIKGNGEIIKISSQASPNTAVVTFLCKDISTGAAVSGSIFQIVDKEGNIVEKIGFNETGRCSNIKLRSGEYTLKEIFTNPYYEFLVKPISFYAKDGEVSEVLIEKSVAIKYTVFSVLDKENKPISNAVLELYGEDGIVITEMSTNDDGILNLSLPSGNYFVKNAASKNSPDGRMISFTVSTSKESEHIFLNAEFYDATITGYVRDSMGNALSGVGVVAVDDMGEEYSIAVSDFEGKYQLDYLPDNSVIHIKVYKAPYGMTGEVIDDRVIMLGKDIKKDIVLMSIDELNASLPGEEKVLSYEFYKLTSDFADTIFQNEEQSEENDLEELSYLSEQPVDSINQNSDEVEIENNITEEEKSIPGEIFIILCIMVFVVLFLVYFYFKKR